MNLSVTVRSGHPAVSFLCGGKDFSVPMRTGQSLAFAPVRLWLSLVFAPMQKGPSFVSAPVRLWLSLVFAPMRTRRGPVLQSSSETEEAL